MVADELEDKNQLNETRRGLNGSSETCSYDLFLYLCDP
jgi:hypothetical protein